MAEPEELLEPGPALAAPALVPCVGCMHEPPSLHLGCSDFCLRILPTLSTHISLPRQST